VYSVSARLKILFYILRIANVSVFQLFYIKTDYLTFKSKTPSTQM